MKTTFLYIAGVFISIAFLLVSFILFLGKGNSHGLTSAKLRLGALLLTASALTAGCRPTRCYAPVMTEPEFPKTEVITPEGESAPTNEKTDNTTEIVPIP